MTVSAHTPKAGVFSLALSALGVVYGDIGTSPLYAFKEAFAGTHGLVANTANVLATLSALFWSVMLIISIKYVGIVLRDRKSTRLNSSHIQKSRMPSSA